MGKAPFLAKPLNEKIVTRSGSIQNSCELHFSNQLFTQSRVTKARYIGKVDEMGGKVRKV